MTQRPKVTSQSSSSTWLAQTQGASAKLNRSLMQHSAYSPHDSNSTRMAGHSHSGLDSRSNTVSTNASAVMSNSIQFRPNPNHYTASVHATSSNHTDKNKIMSGLPAVNSLHQAPITQGQQHYNSIPSTSLPSWPSNAVGQAPTGQLHPQAQSQTHSPGTRHLEASVDVSNEIANLNLLASGSGSVSGSALMHLPTSDYQQGQNPGQSRYDGHQQLGAYSSTAIAPDMRSFDSTGRGHRLSHASSFPFGVSQEHSHNFHQATGILGGHSQGGMYDSAAIGILDHTYMSNIGNSAGPNMNMSLGNVFSPFIGSLQSQSHIPHGEAASANHDYPFGFKFDQSPFPSSNRPPQQQSSNRPPRHVESGPMNPRPYQHYYGAPEASSDYTVRRVDSTMSREYQEHELSMDTLQQLQEDIRLLAHVSSPVFPQTFEGSNSVLSSAQSDFPQESADFHVTSSDSNASRGFESNTSQAGRFWFEHVQSP